MSDVGAESLVPPQPAMSELRRMQIERIFEKLPSHFEFISDLLVVTVDSSLMSARNVAIDRLDESGNVTRQRITATYDDIYGFFTGVSAQQAGYRAGSDTPLWQESFSSFLTSNNGRIKPKHIAKQLRFAHRVYKRNKH